MHAWPLLDLVCLGLPSILHVKDCDPRRLVLQWYQG